jgi:esterase
MKLFYRKYGSGPPLIILHGLYGSSDNWTSIARSLGGYFTTYLPDQRNHGQSPHNPVHNYESLRDDLFELVEDLKLKKFFLAGHSMGGKTAISFALTWPEMLNGLLIADISPFVNEKIKNNLLDYHKTILGTILSTDLSSVSTRTDAETIIRSKIEDERTIGMILKNLQRTDDGGFTWKLDAASLFKNIDNLLEGIDRSSVTNIQITGFPIIFLKGESSDYLQVADFKDIQKVFPAAELVTVRGAGHWIHADQPAEVMENLRMLLV